MKRDAQIKEDEPEEKEQMSEEDSDNDEIMPPKCLLRIYFIVKILSIFVYLGSLFTMFGYYKSSRFASIYLLDLFWIVLLIRPFFIVAYGFLLACLQIHRKASIMRRLKMVEEGVGDAPKKAVGSYMKEE